MSFPEQNYLHILEYNDTVYICFVLQIQSYIIIHIRPVLDNWNQVVKKPKREAQGRGDVRNDNKRGGRGKQASYASTIIGKATLGSHLRLATRPGLRFNELADHLESVLHLRPTVELVKAKKYI